MGRPNQQQTYLVAAILDQIKPDFYLDIPTIPKNYHEKSQNHEAFEKQEEVTGVVIW